MFVALDASYLIDPHPSGIAIYSGELLNGLASSFPDDRYLHLYRSKQLRRAPKASFANVSNRMLLPPLLPLARTDIFHALNQRVDKRIGKRVVCTFHDLFVMSGEYSTPEFRARFIAQARRAADLSDCIITVSAFTRDQVVHYLNVRPDRIRVVPHGVHLVADPPPLQSRERIILSVGALQRRKNIIGLVEAFEQLPLDLVRGWTLLLAGSTSGFGAVEILARIEQSPRRAQIHVGGYLTSLELKDLYRRAAIFAFPSLDEGFGIPVLEAMAHGIPVITSNCSALPEVAGAAALLIDPREPEEISAAMTSMISDPDLAGKLRTLGLRHCAHYSWAETVQLTHAVYRHL